MAERKSFLLRIRPELWDELSRWAADDLRSVNAHIEYLLREAVRRRRGEPLAGGAGERSDAPGSPRPPGADRADEDEGGKV